MLKIRKIVITGVTSLVGENKIFRNLLVCFLLSPVFSVLSGCSNGVIGGSTVPYLNIPIYYPNRSISGVSDGLCAYSAISMWQTYRFFHLSSYGITEVPSFDYKSVSKAVSVDLSRFSGPLSTVTDFYGNDLEQMRADHSHDDYEDIAQWIKLVVGNDISSVRTNVRDMTSILSASCNRYYEPAIVAVRGATFFTIDATESFDHVVLVSGLSGYAGQDSPYSVLINDPNGHHVGNPPERDRPTLRRQEYMFYTDYLSKYTWESWSSNQTGKPISYWSPGDSLAYVINAVK